MNDQAKPISSDLRPVHEQELTRVVLMRLESMGGRSVDPADRIAAAHDLAALRGDVAALIKEMKDLAIREGSRIGQNAAEKISGSASDIYGGVSNKLSVRQRLSVSMCRTGLYPVC